MIKKIEKKTLSISLSRRNHEDGKRILDVDITDVVLNTHDVVNKILDGPFRLIADNLKIDYDHGNILIDGDQVGDSDMHWKDAKDRIQTIINNSK